ncbi:MAG: carbohydrate ABC transporter permease [Sphaerochaetaceae bacterium]|nr:carbohydrate ABC transporter permease [Sphaerochaetaceae bacterium]
MKRSHIKWTPSNTILFIFLFLFGLIWIYPFVWMISASLKTNLEIILSGLNLVPKSPSFDAYKRAWVEARFNTYFLNSILTSAGSILVVVIRCSLAGYVLAMYNFKGKKLITSIMLITFFVPVGTTLIPIVDLSNKLHLLNTRVGLILALSAGGHVSSVLLYRGFFGQTPKSLMEAGIIDGASFIQIFGKIMLPLAGPVTATTIIMTFMSSWNAFMQPLVFTFSNPNLRTLPVGMMAFSKGDTIDYGGQCAAAVLSVTPIAIAYIFAQQYFVNGIAGAVKS